MKERIQSQRQLFNSNITKNVEYRIKQLKTFYSVVKSNEAFLMQAIKDDFKKSKFDTFTNELALLYCDIKEAIRNVKKWSAQLYQSSFF